MIDKDILDKTVEFHGHLCPGLLIGVRSALIALGRFGGVRSQDEEIIAVVENKACGVDALQVLLGTTAGKGNLFFADFGKQAVTVGSRRTNKAIRISYKGGPKEISRAEKIERLMSESDEELFDVVEVARPRFPEKAKVFRSVPCDACGEGTMETALRLLEGEKLCLPCFEKKLESSDFSPPAS